MRQDKLTEGTFSMQQQYSSKGKHQLNQNNQSQHDGGDNIRDVMQKFPLCKLWEETHPKKYCYCWWRADVICDNCKKTGHISKVCN